MKITPSNSTLTCPQCRARLEISEMFQEEPASCNKCNYIEPAGSARFVTFLTEVLTEFLNNIGVKEVSLGGTKIPSIEGALQPNSLLPAILINAKINSRFCGAQFSGLSLTTVNDPEAFYKKRVVTTSSSIKNPSIIISTLAETLYSAYKECQKIPDLQASSTLAFDVIAPISAVSTKDITDMAQTHEDLESQAKQKVYSE